MSAYVICTLSTTASTGALVEGAVGVGAGVAAAAGFEAGVCFEVGPADAGRPARFARGRGCAMALTPIVSSKTRTQGEVRFIKCIFLTVRRIVNSRDACKLLYGLERIDLGGRLVAAKSYDARKAQSVAALVPI